MISAAWNKVKQTGPGWYWICDAAHYGDLYQVCAFIVPFRDHHGWRHPITLVATTRAQAEVAALFGACFDKVIVAPDLQGDAADWVDFYAETGLPAFGLDTPMIIFPVLNPQNAGIWAFTVDDHEMSVTPLIKRMLHLPSWLESCPPPTTPERTERAQAFCTEAGMVKGRAVILCPYARSELADATSHFAALADVLQRLGYQVFTSVAGAEHPITGTVPVTIPFSLLPDVAAHAGWIVAVRSGVADIVSSAACRKSIIYQSFRTLRNWSLDALGLCRDAAELVCHFGSTSPQSFAAAVTRGASHVVRSSVCGLSASSRPTRTASFLALDGRRHGETSFFGFLPSLGSWFRRQPDVLRIIDVPASSRMHAGDLSRGLILSNALAASGEKRRIFACRDGFPPDFFEPITHSALSRGEYYWAGFWHTIVVAKAVTPSGETETDPMLPQEAITFGKTVRPADAAGGRGHADWLTGRLPLCHGGLQFLEGWSALESWGLWSMSCSSILKIILPAAPQADLAVTLRATVAAFSAAMPLVEFDVAANGLDVGHYALAGAADPHLIEIVVPRDAVQELPWVLLRFKFPYLVTPSRQVIGSSDNRTIGLGVHSVRVDLC